MSDTPVTTSRRAPAERLLINDRVRHLAGREGHIIAILDETNEVSVLLDSGGHEVSAPGFWERLPTSRLSA